MVKFHATLSDRTVYLRYFCSLSLVRRTSHERLGRICFCDYDREMVLVAEYRDPQSGELHILAVGRLNKLQTDKEAEVAVVVSDEYQRRGGNRTTVPAHSHRTGRETTPHRGRNAAR